MILQELYINGVLMDLDEKFSIALLYDSMLFTDVSHLMSNRSTGFSLPKTAKNLSAVEHTNLSDIQDDPAVEILYPRRNHKVDYYQNGIPIVTNAVGIMMDISERINFVFVFGNMENTKRLENKMSELPEDAAGASIAWNDSSGVMNYAQANKPGFAYMNFGRGAGMTSNNRQYNHPVVPVNWIIDLIASSNGLTIDRGDHFKDMFIPLMTKNGNETTTLTEGFHDNAFSFYNRTIQVSYYKVINASSGKTQSREIATGTNPTVFNTFRTRVRLIIDLEYTNPSNLQGLFSIYEHPQEFIQASIKNWAPQRINNRWVVKIDEEIDLSNVESVVFALSADTSANYTIYKSSMTFAPLFSDLAFPSIFPVTLNLPDMKQVEFLKHMLQLRGLFAYPKGVNHIGLISADELIAKKPIAPDWTRRLITDSPIPNAPEGIAFRMDNFAQRNWFRWDNDDEVSSENTDAYIQVENETIEREREALKLPFSGSNGISVGTSSVASIPLYDSEGKIKKLKSRVLMGKSGENGRLEVAFEGLDFDSILNRYYDGYRSVVDNPRVITIRVKLTDLDLSDLDLTRPVYFEQFGRYYAILSVQAQPNGLCKCKLLEI